MKKPNDSFLRGRLRSLKFALRGTWLLITTEDSIKAQLFFAAMVTGLGLYFEISNTEWMIQFIIIGMVLLAEDLNTAIEKMADFVHPDYHEKIGFIKDIAAGAPSFAAIISLIISWFIYGQRIIELF
jgi:diacylglycerol kinase (ATP)